jgi:hypothetical protein
MEKPCHQNNDAETEAIPALQSLEKFLTAAGKSRSTGFRWRKLGFLKAVSINGRPYLTRAAVTEFLKRAEAGELAANGPTVATSVGPAKKLKVA